MKKFKVAESFSEFQREYKAGQILTEADFDCWLPEDRRVSRLMVLTNRKTLVEVQDEIEER